LPAKRNFSEISDEIDEALSSSRIAFAEQSARAVLARYVIWIKQHTAATMNVANDLHVKLVDIDVPALETHVVVLHDALEANENLASFVPQLRHLASIIGVPALSVRLTALAARKLLLSGFEREAATELEKLGNLDRISDVLALTTAADVFTISPERREQILIRACTVASCEEEKWTAQFALVEHMLDAGKQSEALPIIISIMAELAKVRGHTGFYSEACVLRWRVTKTESDLRAAMDAVGRTQDMIIRHRFAEILIDEGGYQEAEQVLAADITNGEPVAKLLITDARIRSGGRESARELFLSIERANVARKYLHPYTVAAAHVAVFCNDSVIRDLALDCFKQLPVAVTIAQGMQELLKVLQGSDSADPTASA
jgi:hypothetical protein